MGLQKKHTITIRVDGRTGELTSTVSGLKGKDCSIVSKWVDELGKVTSDQHTPDYYQEPKPVIQIGQSNSQ